MKVKATFLLRFFSPIGYFLAILQVYICPTKQLPQRMFIRFFSWLLNVRTILQSNNKSKLLVSSPKQKLTQQLILRLKFFVANVQWIRCVLYYASFNWNTLTCFRRIEFGSELFHLKVADIRKTNDTSKSRQNVKFRRNPFGTMTNGNFACFSRGGTKSVPLSTFPKMFYT